MNKGFTLIELVGVIVLISLMVLIIVPSVDRIIKKGQSDADNQVKENIVLAAKNWAIDNKDQLPTTVSINTLIKEGYIEEDIVMPSTNEKITNACVEIKIKENSKIYNYKYTKCNGG